MPVTVDDGDYRYGVTINSDYISVSGSDAHGNIPPEFWEHLKSLPVRNRLIVPHIFHAVASPVASRRKGNN